MFNVSLFGTELSELDVAKEFSFLMVQQLNYNFERNKLVNFDVTNRGKNMAIKN